MSNQHHATQIDERLLTRILAVVGDCELLVVYINTSNTHGISRIRALGQESTCVSGI